jgi:hypothetical protein
MPKMTAAMRPIDKATLPKKVLKMIEMALTY